MVELKDFELKIKGMDCSFCAMNQGEGKNIRYSIRNAKVKELLENSDIVLSEVYKDIFEFTRYQEWFFSKMRET